MSTSPYRYEFQPYAGSSSRATCPACGTARSFTRYVDTHTGELLPDRFGRCDRLVKCGHFRPPYGSIDGLRTQRHHYTGVGFKQLSVALAPTQRLLALPQKVCQASLRHYERNQLARLLRDHFGATTATELCTRFRLGTSDHWSGACVFWLLDTQEQVLGGQVVLYDETGHTVKQPHRHTTWPHIALARAYRQRGEAQPAWLTEYATYGQKSPCLFGLPQLATEAADKPIALVESAKTAIVATPYLPEFVWLATMGLSYLTAERLAPLLGRRITLFPDAGALEQWQRKATSLRAKGFNIAVSDTVERLATLAERKAGLDLADVLLAGQYHRPDLIDTSVQVLAG
ncbi:MAG: DUF6371 domain-containing protein [Janthinobacterium lividum]